MSGRCPIRGKQERTARIDGQLIGLSSDHEGPRDRHLRSRALFANWLATTFVFYVVNRLVDYDEGSRMLTQFQQRAGKHASGALLAPETQLAAAGITS